jgi:hypothetical protein
MTLSAEHSKGMVALFLASKARQVAGCELLQATGEGADGIGRELSVVQKGLRIVVVEDVHGVLYKGAAVRITVPSAADQSKSRSKTTVKRER